MEKLKTPINDVKKTSSILKNKFNFDLTTLINPSKREILVALNKYVKKLNKNDNFLIYFAGHGIAENDEGFWLTKEAKKDDDIDWLSNSEIILRLRKIKANNILVIADSCFSGTLTRGLNIEPNEIKITNEILERYNNSTTRLALTSGGNEPVLDGGGLENSIFSSQLINFLSKQNKPFTASDIYLSIRNKIIKNALEYGHKQNPTLRDIPKSGHLDRDFVFIPK